MPAFIGSILTYILTQVTSLLLAKGLEVIHGKEMKKVEWDDINLKLLDFKMAYKEAFNGEPITPEQREKLKKAIADFIRNPGPGL